MALQSTTFTVTPVAQKILEGKGGTAGSPVTGIMFVPAAGQTVFIGGADVTVANGFPVPTGTFSPALDLISESIWAVVAATTQAVNILARGL